MPLHCCVTELPEQSKSNSSTMTTVNIIVENAATSDLRGQFKDPKLINFSCLTPDKLCRICGRISETELTPIYSDWSIKNHIPDVINKYLPIEVSNKANPLPSNICVQCVTLILDWQSLIERSLKTNDWLHNVFEVPMPPKNVTPLPSTSKNSNSHSSLSAGANNIEDKSVETNDEMDDVNVHDDDSDLSDHDTSIRSTNNNDDNCNDKSKRHSPRTSKVTSKNEKSKSPAVIATSDNVKRVSGTSMSDKNKSPTVEVAGDKSISGTSKSDKSKSPTVEVVGDDKSGSGTSKSDTSKLPAVKIADDKSVSGISKSDKSKSPAGKVAGDDDDDDDNNELVSGTWKSSGTFYSATETSTEAKCGNNSSSDVQSIKKYPGAKQVRYKIFSLLICDKENDSASNNNHEQNYEDDSDEEDAVKVSSTDDSNKENQLENNDKQGGSASVSELSRFAFVDETDYEPDSTLLVPAAITKASDDYILRERYRVKLTLIKRQTKNYSKNKGVLRTVSVDTIEKINIVLCKELNNKQSTNNFKHCRQAFSKLAIFNCQYCVYHNMTATEFGRHMRKVHSTLPFMCPICDAVFKEDYNLIIHLQVTSCSKKWSVSEDEDPIKLVDGESSKIANQGKNESDQDKGETMPLPGSSLSDLNVYFRLLHTPIRPSDGSRRNGKNKKINIEYLSTCNINFSKRKTGFVVSTYEIMIETWRPAKSNVIFEPGFILLNTPHYFDAQLNSIIFTEIGNLIDMTMFSLFDCNCLRTVIGTKVVDVVESIDSDKAIKVKLSVSTELNDKNLPIIKTMETDIGVPQDSNGNTPRKTVRGYPSLKEIFGAQPKPVIYKPKQDENSNVKCHVCDEYFSNTDERRKHKRLHHTEVKCGHCNVMFSNLILLWEHRAQHNIRRNLSLNCEKCNLFFDKVAALRKHNLLVHKIGEFFKCDTCNKRFVTKTNFQNHMKNVHATQLHLCPHCGHMLKTRAALRCHIKDIHSGENEFSKCSTCHKTYKSKQKLRSHLLEHRVNREVFTCPQCNKKFNSKDALKQHQKVHEVKPVVHCVICGIGYNRSSRLPVHLKASHWTSVNKPASEQFPCLVCGVMLENGDSLCQHMMFHSDDDKVLEEVEGTEDGKWKCLECGKTLLAKKSLALHRFFLHKDQPFKCKYNEECDNKFWSKAGLDEHIIKVHDGAPSTCNICKKDFNGLRKMDMHMRRKHKQEAVKEKNHSCLVCGKKFRNKYTLDMHSITHSGIKQYECDRCDKRFTFPQILAKHKLWHKRDDERVKKVTDCNEDSDGLEDREDSVLVQDGVHLGMEISEEFIVDQTVEEVEVVASTSMVLSGEMYNICTMYNCAECNIMFKNKNEYELHCSNTHNIEHTEFDGDVSS